MKNSLSKALTLALLMSAAPAFGDSVISKAYNACANLLRNNRQIVALLIAGSAATVAYKNRDELTQSIEDLTRSVKENQTTYAALCAALGVTVGYCYKYGIPSCLTCTATK